MVIDLIFEIGSLDNTSHLHQNGVIGKPFIHQGRERAQPLRPYTDTLPSERRIPLHLPPFGRLDNGRIDEDEFRFRINESSNQASKYSEPISI
jgi:hypothetical protein